MWSFAFFTFLRLDLWLDQVSSTRLIKLKRGKKQEKSHVIYEN